MVTLVFSARGTMERTVKRRRMRAFPGPLNFERWAGVPGALVGRSEPTTSIWTDQCFDRFGGLGWQLFLGFGADDHFFWRRRPLGQSPGWKVRAPPAYKRCASVAPGRLLPASPSWWRRTAPNALITPG